MPAPSVNDLVAQLQTYRLLPADQLAVVTKDLAPLFPDPKNLVRDLVLRGWLTPHQANRLLQGRGSELAAPQPIVTQPTLLDSGPRWRLGLILGGAFLLIVLIVLLTRPKSNKEDRPPDPDEKDRPSGKSVSWPEDLKPLPGRTESKADFQHALFSGKHTRGNSGVEVQGRLIEDEVVIDKIIVRQGLSEREYTELDDVPAQFFKTAQTLEKLARRRVFGEWIE